MKKSLLGLLFRAALMLAIIATVSFACWFPLRIAEHSSSKLQGLSLFSGSLIGLLLVVALNLARTGHAKSRVLRLIRERLKIRVRELTAELRELHQQFQTEISIFEQTQREFSGQLLRLRDEEQRRIARELHDGTTQMIAALAIDLERIREVVARGNSLKAQELLVESRELAEQASAELRTISYLRHPPMLDNLGLEGVLPVYVTGFSSRSGISVNLSIQPELGRLPAELELTLFRVLQEALANIHRHSRSSTAEIALCRAENQVTLQISDQGRGIPAKILESLMNRQAFIGIGIAGMRERVRQLEGSLDIESDNHGTSIKVTLPIKTNSSPKMKAIAATGMT